MQSLNEIITDEQTGKPTIKGTYVTTDIVIDKLADGATIEEIAQTLRITKDQIKAVLKYTLQVRQARAIYLYANNTDSRYNS
ncbi:MAG: hypothetical protein A2249_01545 [Candidatus Jacksonbacteria bacterium RIFOXYA2_FULL_44_7]|uniref:DUF433 domain-containing protein n=1 Tax=Candidatus Jacksonbacteria bacterium RIFCSPLOWO2_02_FULL_44_20 TaxID=1798460 RepID=A0A1G2AAN0_9BACT|nr:MAG: hypothetical protein UW39_C0023G0003 [Parcubacteria group bacterium GW2011_GWC2_44_17]KKT48940.1 MAG: hypothetical protein UW40_C0029G0003 [Parcubacteria group bacterium GW2011_GWF2_44_17]OGY72345.1 MAG: hypothetical protein A3E05_02075 [Candidatus Jacksonbacteria bacterium RIFCSPHIGHO2_12_FULL_44_12]OGY73943.1 MAG: hypothetical protein A3H61_02045 [Candidatus Jacksonbacteria bacterium RIFCSPLOWO2_02_FULL_44_20]OGY74267.1 MAG: hypothetical protein A3H07_03455 [Candidatus Jacksonbacteria